MRVGWEVTVGVTVHAFILDTHNCIAALLLLQLVLGFHGFHESQIAAFTSYFSEVPSLLGKPRNPMNKFCCDGNRLL